MLPAIGPVQSSLQPELPPAPAINASDALLHRCSMDALMLRAYALPAHLKNPFAYRLDYVLLLHSQVEGGSAFGRLAAACPAAAHQIHRAAALLDPVLEAHFSQVLLPRVAMILQRGCRCG